MLFGSGKWGHFRLVYIYHLIYLMVDANQEKNIFTMKSVTFIG